ncbi:hypothetical protein [Streptomyces sp. TRM68416]|uniref:hypothetical protein n=1 Tax=Streptomyces sp. TRM68416 TaxID=2758412 RepID=UPI001661B8EC|nr:hypothetical protein [Streptomyces sp. TRM68416]MBD0843958.1 hypothetical protein [Streptomyces sp. TRM68416]
MPAATMSWAAWDDDLLGMAGLLFVRWRVDRASTHGHQHLASDGWAAGAFPVVAPWAVARFGGSAPGLPSAHVRPGGRGGDGRRDDTDAPALTRSDGDRLPAGPAGRLAPG